MDNFVSFFKKDFFIKHKFNIFFSLFLILNSIKLVYFNCYLSSNIRNLPLYIVVKFLINIIMVSAIFLCLFKRNLKKTAITFYILQFVYVLAHICYFKYFSNYLHIVQSILLLGEGTKALTHLYFFLDFSIILLFLDIPFFVYIIKNEHRNNSLNISYSAYILDGITLCFIVYAFIYVQYCAYSSNLKEETPLKINPSETYIVRNYGTLVNEWVSLTCNFGDENLVKNLKHGKDIKNTTKSENNPNIVLLQLESIDANVVDKQYKGKYIAPYLHSLTNKCVYYPYTMSYHMGGGTSDAEFSIINSVEPSPFFPAMKSRTYSYSNSMIRQFKNSGYDCFAFHGNVGDYFNRNEAFSSIGFSKFYDIGRMFLHHVGWGAPDEDVLNFATNKLVKNKNPFLSYVITMTSHASFTSVYNYYSNSNYDDINDTVVKDYFTSVSYVDETLKKFITNIRKEIPNTYVLIWGDHTPAIDKPEYSQASMSYDGKYFEFVPLFIITPDDIAYRETSKVASFLDIAPTILNLSGIEYVYKSDGDDLLNLENHDSKIPFKGGVYSKSDLFTLITNSNK